MNLEIKVIIVLIILVIILFFLWRRSSSRYQNLNFRKYSLSTRYGKMTEQYFPFLKKYPYLPENFRFLGSPIDGIQFEEDKIIFIEFKAASAPLTVKQKQIANLVNQNQVSFEEFRID